MPWRCEPWPVNNIATIGGEMGGSGKRDFARLHPRQRAQAEEVEAGFEHDKRASAEEQAARSD